MCVCVWVGGWVGVWGEGRGVGVHVHMCIVYVIVCGQFYFVINLSGSSKRGVGIYYEVQYK